MKVETLRQRKLADQIKKYVSQIIDRKLKDPRKGFITITHVRVSGDLRIAFIYYTALGDDYQKEQSQKALESAKNFIRNEMAPHLKVRYIPELRFFYDESLDYSRHIEDILKQINPPESRDEGSEESG